MKIILAIVGALFGVSLVNGSVGLYGAIVGGFVGFAIAEMIAARQRADRLENELRALRKQVASRGEAPAATSPGPEAPAQPATPAAGGAVPARPYFEPDERGYVAEKPAAASQASPSSSSWSDAYVPEPTAEPARATVAASEPAAAAGAARPARAPPPPPAELALIRVIREYFTGGNTLVRVGVVILFIGVAFLLRYAAQHTHVPIEFRLSGVAFAGVVLLGLGWRLRKKRPGYALALQGGAIGILYLTVFASLRLFHVLPPGPAFAVLVLLAAFSAALAVLQNSMAFALLGIGCGFLAPILASSGDGNHVVLFSYYSVLNLAILAIAWFKAWRPLNVVGFLFTFVIGIAWGVLLYRPEFLASTEPFLIGFFLLYVAIAILFSLRQRPILRGYVDGTIVFGVPAVAFGLQSALVHDRPFALAYSAVAVSAMYLLLAWMLYRGKRDTQRLLVEAFMALGVVFLTLAVPLALDGRWSAATWALEGAGLVWVGCRQGRQLPRLFGSLLQIAGGIIFLFDIDAPHGGLPVFNSAYLGAVMIAVASVFAARSLRKAREDLREHERSFEPILFVWGLIWWLVSGIDQILRYVPDPYGTASVLVFVTATALISSELHRRLEISIARFPALFLLPLMVVFALLAPTGLAHPFAEGGWAAWPLAFAGFYFLCRRHEDDEGRWFGRWLHSVSAFLLLALVSWEFAWEVDQAVAGSGSWPAIAWALIPGVALVLLPKLAVRFAWPFGKHQETYVALVGAGVAVYLMLWSLVTNFTLRGDPFPLPYVPLLNPLDLAQAFVLLVLVRYCLHLRRAKYAVLAELGAVHVAWVLAALAFVWVNAVLLRTLHHWAGVPFELEAMARSALVQTSLSIFWTVLALATMFVATRNASRVVWIAGAVLLAVVIGKLFLIDLSRVGTVERIVSFVVVGLLMLVVGYFSPLPPARKEKP